MLKLLNISLQNKHDHHQNEEMGTRSLITSLKRNWVQIIIYYFHSLITTILPAWRSEKSAQFEREIPKLEADTLSQIIFSSSRKALIFHTW